MLTSHYTVLVSYTGGKVGDVLTVLFLVEDWREAFTDPSQGLEHADLHCNTEH